jgi:hypothetical protein
MTTSPKDYMEAIDALIDDAVEREQAPALADALAWATARLIVGFGVPAAGDILKRLGGYVVGLSEHRRAQEQAERERHEGAPVH